MHRYVQQSRASHSGFYEATPFEVEVMEDQMPYPKLVSVRILEDYVLLVEFTNQIYRKYDVRPLLSLPMFAPLQSLALFRSFRIEAGGHGLVWNEEIDVSEYELWSRGEVLCEAELSRVKAGAVGRVQPFRSEPGIC